MRSEHPAGAYAARVLRAGATELLRSARAAGELSVLVTGDAQIRVLNREYRRKDRPTDVLSFPQADGEGPGRAALLGDVVISLDTARRQAREAGRPLNEELVRLLGHGLLHLLGYDHETPDDARRMAAAERRLLGGVGMVAETLQHHPAALHFRRTRRSTRRPERVRGGFPGGRGA